jgi:hypothetical protein
MGMAVGTVSGIPGNTARWSALVLLGQLGACHEAEVPPPDVRLVTGDCCADQKSVTLTGHVQAQDEVSRAFWIDGRMLERGKGNWAGTVPA